MANEKAKITEDDLVEQVMNEFPGTIAVFLRHRMSCIGCMMGRFHTIADAAEEYGLDVDDLLAELRCSLVAPGCG